MQALNIYIFYLFSLTLCTAQELLSHEIEIRSRLREHNPQQVEKRFRGKYSEFAAPKRSTRPSPFGAGSWQ